GAEREQGGIAALQEPDRHDERRVRPDAPSRHAISSPGGREQRARDRARRNRRAADRGGDAGRDSRRLPSRRAGDLGRQLRRQARAPPFLSAKDSGMSDAVTLTLVTTPTQTLVADGIAADRFAALSAQAIAALPVVHGARPATLGDFFRVRGERASVVRIEGDCAWIEAIGSGMAGGELVIDGSVGRDLGVAMSGGRIAPRGNAGANAGAAPAGAARGMTGGEIIVRGSVGDEAGARMRRGLIVVTGDGGRGT